jgi:hypothetical protein
MIDFRALLALLSASNRPFKAYHVDLVFLFVHSVVVVGVYKTPTNALDFQILDSNAKRNAKTRNHLRSNVSEPLGS